MVFYGFTTLASALLNARHRFVAAAFAPVVNNVVVIVALLVFVVPDLGPAQHDHRRRPRAQRPRALVAPRHRHDRGHRRDGSRAGAGRRPRRCPAPIRARLARPGDPDHPAAVGLDRGLRRHEPARAAVRAGAREQLGGQRLRVRLRVHVLRRAARTARGLDHDDDDARTSRAARAPATSTGCAASSDSVCATSSCWCCPASVLFAVLAQPMLGVIVRHQFTAHDAVVTADTLQAFAISLVPFSVYLYVMRAFYALQDTRTPFVLNAFENGAERRARDRAVPPPRRPGSRARVERRVPRRRGRSRSWSCGAASAASPTRRRCGRRCARGRGRAGAGRRRGPVAGAIGRSSPAGAFLATAVAGRGGAPGVRRGPGRAALRRARRARRIAPAARARPRPGV